MTAKTLDQYKSYLSEEFWIFQIHCDTARSFSPYYNNPQARCTKVSFPEKASEFAHLASSLPQLLGSDAACWEGGTLVYSDWGVWEQRANLAGYQMVERIRSTFGELRPFHVAPVQDFRQDEQLLLTNFVLAALIYGWDATYIPNSRGAFAHISHDGLCWIVTERDEDFAMLIQPKLADSDHGFTVCAESRFCRAKPEASQS